MTVYVRAIDGMSNFTAADARGTTNDLISSAGVVDLAGGHLLVSANGTPDMSVDIAAGIGYVLNSAWTAFSSDQRYWDVIVDALVNNLSISANPSGSTRIDKICLKVDVLASPNANASNVASVVVVAGTPGAGTPATPADHLLLATITVVNGATSIGPGAIVDSRVQIGIRDVIVRTNILPRSGTVASSATPSINTNNIDFFTITALAANITSMTSGLTGTPVSGQVLKIRIKDNGTARTITWGASFASRGATLPTTTVLGKYQYNGFLWNEVTSTWDCVVSQNET